MKDFIITEELAVKIITYLQEQPYKEVSYLINAMQTTLKEYKHSEPDINL